MEGSDDEERRKQYKKSRSRDIHWVQNMWTAALSTVKPQKVEETKTIKKKINKEYS